MLRLLAFDTSSKTGAFAAIEWDPQAGARTLPRVVSESILNVDAGMHSERLLWSIHTLLQSARWKLEDIDVFGVGIGPGSFTGIRIGLTTARTLAHTLKKPLVGVSSMSALVRPAALWLAQREERIVVAATTQACKGELYAMYGSARSMLDCVVMSNGDQAGLWKRGVEECVIKPPELIKAMKKKISEGGSKTAASTQWVVVGEGRSVYEDHWKELPLRKKWVIPDETLHQVQGRYVAWLAWEGYQAGLARESLLVHPRYLRASDAELKLKAGLLPKAP